MLFEGIGALSVDKSELTPNFAEYTDGATLVFDMNEQARLLVSNIANDVVLCLGRGEDMVTYRGQADAAELEELNNIFFGGSEHV